MNDRDALFANVLNQPADDTARLVLADWLEENGEEAFGQFLRAGVVASRFRDMSHVGSPDFDAALAHIAAFAKAGQPAWWLSQLGVGPSPLTDADWAWDNAGDRVAVRVGKSFGVFTRGLLSELSTPLGVWYDLAPRAFAGWPLGRVVAADLPGLSFWIDSPDSASGGWKFSAAVTLQPRRPRRRGLLHRLNVAFGLGEDEPPPVPVSRWAAERTFADREELAAEIAAASSILFEEVRAAAGPQWVPPGA